VRIALACALAQEDVDVHVVVVDDGSADPTARELRALGDDRVRVLGHDRPKGVSAARNLGLAHVTAPWVAFLDDDDVWAPGYLAAMLAAVATSEVDAGRVGFVFSGHLTLDVGWNVTEVMSALPPEAAREAIDSINSVGGPSRVVARTEAVREVGGFDESLSLLADWDLWARILARYELVRCPELLVGYMVHGGNMHLDAELFLDELGMMQSKYGWRPRGSRASARAKHPGDLLPAYIASVYRARGRRVRSARWYLRSFWVYGERRDLARAAGVLLGEWAIEWSGLRERTDVDPSLGRWVEQVRGLAYGPTAGLPAPDEVYRDSAKAR
jgi:glycosyltransferase involved in cell wall biosynthesis